MSDIPAFPIISWSSPDGTYATEVQRGMTFRDYAAVHAMAIVPQQNATNMRPNESGPDYVARRSYEYADAMIKRREA